MQINKGTPHNRNKDTDIIIEYLKKFPEAPTKTLARKIYAEHPKFTSFEGVYTRVRYYRGQLGEEHRKKLKDKSLQKELKVKHIMNEKLLPESHTKTRTQFTFPTGCLKLGVFGDVHIPYHDNTALETMFTKFEE